MLITFMTILNHWQAILGAIVGIGGSILAIYKAYKKIKVKAVKPILDRLEKIDKISETLGPNGGSSLYDKMHAIDRKLGTSVVRSEVFNSVLGFIEWESSPDGQIIKVNDVACRVTVRPEHDFLGNNWMNVIHDDDQEAVFDEWRDSLLNRKDFKMKYRWTTSHGTPVVVDVVAKPVYDSVGKLTGYLGSGRIVG